MKPSQDIQQVIEILARYPSSEGKVLLEDLNLMFREVASEDMGYSEYDIRTLGFEMSDLMATYGEDADAVALIGPDFRELELWGITKDGSHSKIVHAVNFDDKAFTNNVYVVGMPFGNFSSEYIVYADNEQDALDALVDYEVARRAVNPDVRIVMVDESDFSADEIEEKEQNGELTRLGNNGNLCDISDVIVKSATTLSIDKDTDINMHLRQARKHEQPSLGF